MTSLEAQAKGPQGAFITSNYSGVAETGMSSFAALNLSNNENIDEAKDHNRELQVEESSKIFQLALLQLKAKRYDDAKDTFYGLFDIDVMKPNKWGIYEYSSPTLDSLRYLAYRNRGILYYQYVKENFESMPSDEVVDNVLKCLEYLLESLQHGEADNTVIHMLLSIFLSVNSAKLSRSILEYELTKCPEELRLLSSFSALFRVQKRAYKHYTRVLERLNDMLMPSSIPESVNEVLQYIYTCDIEPIELDPVLQRIKKMKSEDTEIIKGLDCSSLIMHELSWEEIAINLRSLLPRTKVQNLLGKKSDTYSDLESPIECVLFVTEDENNKAAEVSIGSIEQSPEHYEDAVSVIPDPISDTIKEDKDLTVKRQEPSDRPAQRSSKRFKEKEKISEPDVEEQVEFHTKILSEINHVLHSAGIVEDLSVDLIDPNVTSQQQDLCMSDFFDCLSSWNNKHTEFLKQGQGTFSVKKDSTDDFSKLTLLLRNSMFAGDIEPADTLSELESDEIKDFISMVNEQKLHFHAVRFIFLQHLLAVREDGSCLITDYFWSPALYEVVEVFAVGLEFSIYEMVDTSNELSLISVGIAIFEILCNLMGSVCNEIVNKKAQGQKYNDQESQKNKLDRKINRWYTLMLSKDLTQSFKFRLQWSHFCYLQCTTDVTNNHLLSTMEDIEKSLRMVSGFGTIPYCNYSNISSLSLKTVQSQFTKIKILRRFSIVDADNEEDEPPHKEYIEQLYCILNNIPIKGPDSDSMHSFITSSPFLMKIKLWKMLIDYFANRSDRVRLQNCYFRSVQFLLDRLTSEEYQMQSQLQRHQTLLSTFNHIGELSKRFYQVILEKWDLHLQDIDKNQLVVLVSIFKLLYPLVYYETLAERNSSLKSFFKKAVKSSSVLQEIFLVISSLIIITLRALETEKSLSGTSCEENVIILISALHTLSGKFEFCDKFDSNFLKVEERVLCESSSATAFDQLRRVLWCRYHISIGLDNPEDHYQTKPQIMTKSTAIMLSNHLIKFQYPDRNILVLNNTRSAFKQFFEVVMELIGDINYESSHVLSRNEYFFNQFFSAPITLKTIRDAYGGELEMEFTSPNDDMQSGVDGGLFYVSAVHALNQYKSRKKSMQARPSELDAIISTLTTDILYNTKRFESWYLLGKCFSFVVEDDLTWTSDKLATRDKKQATAFAEKKALLCYLMALNLYLHNSDKVISEQMRKDNKIIFRNLLESLGKEMLQAYCKPMSSVSYTWQPKPILKLKDDGTLENIPVSDIPSISETNIRRCIIMILAKADTLYDKDEERNWMNPFYISKIHLKTDKHLFKDHGIHLMQEACRLSSLQSSRSASDAILESHYALVSATYKCHKSNDLSTEEAITELKRDNDFFGLSDSEWDVKDPKQFYELILKLLKRIISKDKQKWQHRPIYRIAQIKYFDFGDTDGAMEEMNKLLALKSVNKNVVNIWKPENELPGKHFVYAYQYVVFYMDLLNEKHDFMSIGSMIKKLRRFGSGMIKSQDAINKAVELFVNGSRTKLLLNEKEHGDFLMQRIPFPEFVQLSEELQESFNKADYPPDVLDVFLLAFNLKKGTNSIQFDGICITIYFKYIYCPFAEQKKASTPNVLPALEILNGSRLEKSPSELTPVQDSLSPSDGNKDKEKPIKPAFKTAASLRKRVSKKDVFDRIIKLIEKGLS